MAEPVHEQRRSVRQPGERGQRKACLVSLLETPGELAISLGLLPSMVAVMRLNRLTSVLRLVAPRAGGAAAGSARGDGSSPRACTRAGEVPDHVAAAGRGEAGEGDEGPGWRDTLVTPWAVALGSPGTRWPWVT